MFRRVLFLLLRTWKGGAWYARKLGVTIGSGCRIYTTQFGSEPFLISIGNKVTVTSGVKFVTHDGSAWLMRDERGRRYVYMPISIGNSVFIGVNSIILPGVKIDDRVVVAAGSVVTKSIPAGVIVAGVPAKIIGKYDEMEEKMLSTYIADDQMDKSLDYEARILKVTTRNYKPYLK